MKYLRLAGLLLLVFYASPALSENYIDEIKARGELRVGIVNLDRPPFFERMENGRLRGSDIKLAKEIAKQFGVKLTFVRTASTFNEVIKQVEEKEVDIGLSKLTRTLRRSMKISFTQPYYCGQRSLLINRLMKAKRRPTVRSKNIYNSPDATIGYQAETAYEDFVKRDFPNATLVKRNSIKELFDDVLAGKIFAAYFDELEMINLIKDNEKSAIKLQVTPIKDKYQPISIAVHPARQHLLSWLNLFLLSADKTGRSCANGS